jgi:hypothetical protein
MGGGAMGGGAMGGCAIAGICSTAINETKKSATKNRGDVAFKIPSDRTPRFPIIHRNQSLIKKQNFIDLYSQLTRNFFSIQPYLGSSFLSKIIR